MITIIVILVTETSFILDGWKSNEFMPVSIDCDRSLLQKRHTKYHIFRIFYFLIIDLTLLFITVFAVDQKY